MPSASRWVSTVDSTSGRVMYTHLDTAESRWQRPTDEELKAKQDGRQDGQNRWVARTCGRVLNCDHLTPACIHLVRICLFIRRLSMGIGVMITWLLEAFLS